MLLDRAQPLVQTMCHILLVLFIVWLDFMIVHDQALIYG